MVLEISDLNKEFIKKDQKVKAVIKASMKIKSGEFISILGPSGSGKSTLFHLITGLQRPTSGYVKLDTSMIHKAGAKELSVLRNKKIGYVLQEQNLLKNFTVIENVCMPNFISKVDRNTDIYKKAEEILAEVGLLHLKNAYPNELSGGEARRAAIARALINDPAIIIADEPTSNLDPENSLTVMRLFRKISKNGVAVLISTHDLKFIDFSDKVLNMRYGQLLEEAAQLPIG